nr:hypothetical protein [Tanacetum cinerariifolium]GEZ51346.1 hypothetical protein [Tanacetum cinerariifolium]
IRRWRCNLTPAESKFKTPMLDHQDKYMMKAQHILRGILLASFQDLKHEGGDTRSYGGIKDNDSKIKIQDHRRANDHSNEFPRTRLQVSRKEQKQGNKVNNHHFRWVIIIINPLDLTTISFGVDAAMDLEEKHLAFNAASEELSAAKQKLMLLDSAAEGSLMLLSQVKTINDKCC